MYRKVRITVLRKAFNDDFVEQYWSDDSITICDAFQEGQQFIIEGWPTKPDGFCDWAWTDIHKYVLAIVCGGNFAPWVREKGTAIACCTDGYRPVVFKIEAIE